MTTYTATLTLDNGHTIHYGGIEAKDKDAALCAVMRDVAKSREALANAVDVFGRLAENAPEEREEEK